jgi:hypothetical protein
MSARFRIRTPTGQELSFASLDVFREFVRSGDLSPDDVVYDAATREWSSARTHPVVLEIELEAEDSAAATSEGGAEAAAPPEATAVEPPGVEAPNPTFAMGGIGLDLAPAPNQLSPEQEAVQFLAKLEAERAGDLSASEDVPIQSFTMEQSEPLPAAPAGAVSASTPELAPRSFRQERMAPAPARPAPVVEPKPNPAWKYAPFAILVLVLAGVGLYFGSDVFAPVATEGSDPAAGPVTAPPAPTPVIPATDEALRGRATERYLTSTQSLLRQLEPIPQAWLSGRYLAEPSDHANVRDVWTSYLGTVREIRAGDDDRYRAAYGRALDDAGVQEPARAARLATGMTQFQARSADRNGHWDRVERLATVAISGHDALVTAEGRILYEPATGPRVSNDPVIEAVGRTSADQALLDEILDAVLGELRGQDGPGTASNVREWVYEGLLDAVTN